MVNPLAEYNSITLNRQQNPLDGSEYCEVHHIIPRACGGGDAEWNLVRLTPEEHYRCHELLPFIYTEGKEHGKMVYAWNMMGRIRGVKVDDEIYGQLRREYAEMRCETPGTFTGRKHSEESKRLMSKAHTGKPSTLKGRPGRAHTEEEKRHISEIQTGKRHSEEWNRHISNGHKKVKHHLQSEQTRAKIAESVRRYWENKRKVIAA